MKGLTAVARGDRVDVWALLGTHRSRSDTCQPVLADTELAGIHGPEGTEIAEIHGPEDTEFAGIHPVILVAADTVHREVEEHHRSSLVAPTVASDPCWDRYATALCHFD